jgi:hypothetical protein
VAGTSRTPTPARAVTGSSRTMARTVRRVAMPAAAVTLGCHLQRGGARKQRCGHEVIDQAGRSFHFRIDASMPSAPQKPIIFCRNNCTGSKIENRLPSEVKRPGHPFSKTPS